MARSPAVAGRGHSLPSPCPTAGKPAVLLGVAAKSSERQAHQLLDRQRQDAEHQVAPHLARAANSHVPPAKLVLEPSVHPLHGRALPGAPCLGRHLADAALGQRFPLPLGFHLRPPAGIEVDDRHMPQLLAEGPDLGRVIGAVHQVVEAVDSTRGQPRQRDRRLTVVHRG